MAMDGDVLGMAIATVIATSAVPPADPASVAVLWKKIAKEIVNHIKTNSEVPAGISVSTTGNEIAQTGATTGKGKVI